MSKRKIAVRAAIVAIGFIVIEYLYPFVWISLPISGRVIDRDTHQPIAGAIVASIWRLDGGPVDNNRVDTLAAREAFTNPAGEFTIGGWGPKFNFGWGSIHSDQPLIAVFKDAYLPYPHEASAHWLPEPFFALHKVVQPIELAHAENSTGYGDAIGGLIREIIDQFPKANSCHWTEIPNTVSTLQRAAQALQSAGIDTHGRFGLVVLGAKPCAH